MKYTITFILLLCVTGYVNADCWDQAAERYELNTKLLMAIAELESSYDPNAINKNTNGTFDIGLMQINTSWLDELSPYGITLQDLFKPCTNLMVGAWILRQEIDRYGNVWEAVGAYNTGAYTEKTRRIKIRRMKKYAWKIYEILNRDGDRVH